MTTHADDLEWRIDLDVKLAFQERLIRDLDALVRAFAERLAKTEKELGELKLALGSPEATTKASDDRPPHY